MKKDQETLKRARAKCFTGRIQVSVAWDRDLLDAIRYRYGCPNASHTETLSFLRDTIEGEIAALLHDVQCDYDYDKMGTREQTEESDA